MKVNKKQKIIENTTSFFAWVTGLLTALVIGYALINGPLTLPEPFENHLISNFVGWLTIASAVITIILSFFRR